MRTQARAVEPIADPVRALAAPGRGAALLGGAAAGIALVTVEALATKLLLGAAPKAALHELTAAAMAGNASAGVLVVALAGLLTIVLAVVYGAIVAVVARRYAAASAWWTGAAAGLTVYVLNFHFLLAPSLRWIGEVRDQVSVLSPWYLVSLWP
jgi:hypothetical protein